MNHTLPFQAQSRHASRLGAPAVIVAVLLGGCASGNSSGKSTQSRAVLGGDEDVLGVAGSGLRSLGYSTYFGNRGMVVGSDQDATLATPFALVGGVVAMPLFFATWPIVVALAEPGSRDGPAWWPVVPLRPWINSFDRHTIYVSLGPSEIGLITVIARATGPEPRRSRDLEALWEFLGSHFELTVEAPEIDGRTLAPR